MGDNPWSYERRQKNKQRKKQQKFYEQEREGVDGRKESNK